MDDVALDVTRLPQPLVRDIFELLPLDTRLRCVEVCRAWRRLFSKPDMWTYVEFQSLSKDKYNTPLTTELAWAAAARARGCIEVLDLCCCAADPLVVTAVVAASGGALRDLELNWVYHSPQALRTLLRAAPNLHTLSVDLGETDEIDGSGLMGVAEALPMLRGDPPWWPLKWRSVSVALLEGDPADATRALAEALRLNADLFDVRVFNLGAEVEPDAFKEMCVAVVATGARTVYLRGFDFLPAAAAAGLETLLQARCMVSLTLLHKEHTGFDPETVKPVAAALKQNDTLTSLTLKCVNLWGNPMAGYTICTALIGHPSIKTLILDGNCPINIGAGDEMLGAMAKIYAMIIEANAPALKVLSIASCGLKIAVMQPILAALRGNTHLQLLDMVLSRSEYYNPDALAAFEENELLPAVTANTGLRGLAYILTDSPVRTQIDAMLQARQNADDEAERHESSDDNTSVADELGAEAMAGAPP